jgi:hypothetical protein
MFSVIRENSAGDSYKPPAQSSSGLSVLSSESGKALTYFAQAGTIYVHSRSHLGWSFWLKFLAFPPKNKPVRRFAVGQFCPPDCGTGTVPDAFGSARPMQPN